MLNEQLFEFATVKCANDYAMAWSTREAKDVLDYITNNNLRIDNLKLKPATNQFRFTFLPCKANNNTTEVFNLNNPSVSFLRTLWDLDIEELSGPLNTYMLRSDVRNEYDNLNADEQEWITSFILGSKE